MKKIFTIAAALTLCILASAQKPTGVFAGFGGGLNVGFDGRAYEDRVNSHIGAGLAMDINFGYWYNELGGFRVGFQGLNISDSYTDFGKQRYEYIHADMLFRPLANVIPYVHAGLVRIENRAFGGGLGIMFPINVSKRVSIVPDLKATGYSNSVYMAPGNLPSVNLSATIGLAINLGKMDKGGKNKGGSDTSLSMDGSSYAGRGGMGDLGVNGVAGGKGVQDGFAQGSAQKVYIRDTVTVEKIIRDTVVLKSNDHIATLSAQMLFDSNKTELRPEGLIEIGKVAGWLNEHPSIDCVIEGHTDNVGNEAYNQTLSEKRAEAVRKALISAGIPASRMSAKGLGQSAPVAPNDTPEGRQQNRRVEIRVK